MIALIKKLGSRKLDDKQISRIIRVHQPEWYKEVEDEYTPFMIACMYKQEKLAIAFIATGKARLDYITPTQNISSFYWACYCGLPNVALELIENNIPINIPTKKGETAFHFLSKKREDRLSNDINENTHAHLKMDTVIKRLHSGKIIIKMRRVSRKTK